MRQCKSKGERAVGGLEPLESRQLCSAVAGVIAPPVVGGQQTGLSVVLGTDGISKLTYNGSVMYNDVTNPIGAFCVQNVVETNGGTKISPSISDAYTSAWNASNQTLTLSFAWGTVGVKYTVATSSVSMAITVSNTSTSDTIEGLDIFPLIMQFPQTPTGFNMSPQVAFGNEGPGVTVANFGTGAVAMIEQDTNVPTYNGFLPYNATSQDAAYEAYIGTAAISNQPSSWPILQDPIAPNTTHTYNIALRFGPNGSTASSLGSDVIAAYTAANPSGLTWADRAPIGILQPAGSSPAGRSSTNPRGWFNDPSVNVTTTAGLSSFSQEFLDYAAASITELKSMGSQGMVTWDLEGEQFPQPITYIGDPRQATTLAPELATMVTKSQFSGDAQITADWGLGNGPVSLVDAYFAMFRNAGLETGVTIRPQQFVDTNGVGTQQTLTNPASEVALLVSKIQYAEQQWGCTLFYVDSIDPFTASTVLQDVYQQCPGILLVPEHSNTSMYSSSAPFMQVGQTTITTPASALLVYPDAFTVIDASLGPVSAAEPILINDVRDGDILMFSGWYNARDNQIVKKIYQMASQPQAQSAKALVGKLPMITGPAASLFSSTPVSVLGPVSLIDSVLGADSVLLA